MFLYNKSHIYHSLLHNQTHNDFTNTTIVVTMSSGDFRLEYSCSDFKYLFTYNKNYAYVKINLNNFDIWAQSVTLTLQKTTLPRPVFLESTVGSGMCLYGC